MALRKQHFDDNDAHAPHEVAQPQLSFGVDPALLQRIENVASEHGLSVMELAQHFSLPATYDAQYLALAQYRACELWTADTRM